MDQPNKLLATAARRGMRFIDLPDHIVHHILSYLAIEDLARLSVASTRCRELCISVPSLTIDNKKFTVVSDDRLEGFSNFIYRFLGQRLKLGLDMQRFCLRWSFKNPLSLAEKYRVETWMCYASYSKVKELDLEINPQLEHKDFSFSLPVSVLSCHSLRSLNLDMHQGILKLPPSGFTALKTLRLNSVRIKQESFGEWVSTCCQSLRELVLRDLYGVKTISIISSSLEVLRVFFYSSRICHVKISAPKLHTLVMHWFPISSSSKSLIITAPNLKLLMWRGYLIHQYYHVEKFLHLQFSAILLRPPPQFSGNEDFTGLNLSKIVSSVSKAETLCLDDKFVEVLFMRGCLPFTIDDLLKLIINVGGLSDTLVPAITSLLKGMPALEFLAIGPLKSHTNNYNASPSNQVTNLSPSEEMGFNIEYWESQKLGFTDHLKEATIKLCAGQNELELIKYLLKHSKALTRMDLHYSLPLPPTICTELMKLKNSFPAVHLYDGVISFSSFFSD